MFCEPTSASPNRPLAVTALAALLLFSSACGHKQDPFPPPLRHPATSTDLVVQQRGEELILTFAYPQTTVSGTVLEPLQIVEYWELTRAVQAWVPPTPETEAATEPASEEGPGDESGVTGSDDAPNLPEALILEEGEAAPEDGEEAKETDGDAVANGDVEGDVESAASEAGSAEADLLPPPTPPSDEELLQIDALEFAATANLQTTLEGPALTAATFGDRIVLTLPLEAPVKETPEEKSSETEEAGGAEVGIEETSRQESRDEEVGAEDEDLAEADMPELVYGKLFAIKTGVNRKLTSAFSNVVAIAYRTAPEAPAAFSLEPTSDRVTIRWTSENEDLVGYHVYRRDAQSPTYGPPLAFVPPAEPLPADPADAENGEAVTQGEDDAPREQEYSDLTALYGQRYIYAVTAVSNQVPVVESAINIEREIDYADRFAPTTPQRLIALAEAGRIRLLWNASPQNDVVGYTVSRSERGGEFVPLHDEPIAELEYNDRDIRGGQSYTYQVIALDEAGNKSGPSQAVSVRAP